MLTSMTLSHKSIINEIKIIGITAMSGFKFFCNTNTTMRRNEVWINELVPLVIKIPCANKRVSKFKMAVSHGAAPSADRAKKITPEPNRVIPKR
jgi:hypothetical protein